MRFEFLASLLLGVFLGLVLLGTGCTSVPVSSLMKLGRVDFETTDLSALRAAVLLPSYLRPLPGTGQLTITLDRDDGTRLQESFGLRETDDPEAALLNEEEGKSGQRLYAYALSPEAARTLSRLRTQAAATHRPGTKQNLSLAIGAKACHVGKLPAGPLPMTSYLKTPETRSFVPLARNMDLRKLAPTKVLDLAPCPG